MWGNPSKIPRILRAGLRRSTASLGGLAAHQGFEHIGAADNANELAVSQDWEAFHPAMAHQCGKEVDWRLIHHGNGRFGHDVVSLQVAGGRDLFEGDYTFAEEP